MSKTMDILKLKIDEKTLSDAYDNYNSISVLDDPETKQHMNYNDFTESILDSIHGEVRHFLKNTFKMVVDSPYKSGIKNTHIDIDNGLLVFPVQTLDNFNLEVLEEYLNENIPLFLVNSINKNIDVNWELFINDKMVKSYSKKYDGDYHLSDDESYSKMSKNELNDILNKALDKGDIEKVKHISKYLKESFVYKYSQFIKIK